MKIFLVGGAVRDQLLNYPYFEKDWVVVGATPEQMIKKGFTPVGKDFPVFLHPDTHEEYALARTERKTAPGYKGFTFHTHTDVTLEDDLYRRDLTINAIARDNDGHLIDPYQGQQDIQQRILRHVSPAFSEDPVRILRVARFAARYHHLDFFIAPETLRLMQEMVNDGETQHLVAERVWQECEKALTEKNPEQFISVLKSCHAIGDILPAIPTNKINSCQQLLAEVSNQSNDVLMRFSALCHSLNQENIQQLCIHLHTPKHYSELALLSKQHYSLYKNQDTWSTEALHQLFKKTDALRKPTRFQQILRSCCLVNKALGINRNDSSTEHHGPLLLSALEAYRQVNPQTLIAQGYEKAALGKAIEKQRKITLEQWRVSQNIK